MLCEDSQPNPGPASCNNKPRITRDVRVQTGKLDEPIISPPLTVTVKAASCSADLAADHEMRLHSDRSDEHGLAQPHPADFQTADGLRPIRRLDIAGGEESRQRLRPPVSF